MPHIFRLAAVMVLPATTTAGRYASAVAGAPGPDLIAALAQLQAGNAATAAQPLRAVTSKDSQYPQAWRALGTCLRHPRTEPAVRTVGEFTWIPPAAGDCLMPDAA